MPDISELDEYISPHAARESQDLGNEPLMFTPPYANNVVIQIAPASGDSRVGNFTITQATYAQTNAPDKAPDETMVFGYNAGGGAAQKAGEAAFFLAFESLWVPYVGGPECLEFGFRGILKDGTEKRPLHATWDKDTGETLWQQQSSTFSIADPADDVIYFSAWPGSFSFLKGATGGLNFYDNTTQWLIRAAGSATHSLNFMYFNDYYFDASVHATNDVALTRNLFINTTATGSGAGIISIGRATTAPSTNPTNACILYTDPADNVVKIRDTAGVVHVLW